MLRLWLLAAPLLQPVSAAWINCSLSTHVDVRVTRLDIDQELGAERLSCEKGAVHVIRMVKTAVGARAEADARASGSANGSFNGSCYTNGSSCSAHDSGYGSCSDSGSDSTSRSEEKETVFTVARADAAGLSAKGYTVSGDGETCRLLDSKGAPVDPLRAVALVTTVYAEQLLIQTGADPAALKRAEADKAAGTQ